MCGAAASRCLSRDIFSHQLVSLDLHQKVCLDDTNSVQKLRDHSCKGGLASPRVTLKDHVVLATSLHLVSGILALLVQDDGMVKLSDLLLQQLQANDLRYSDTLL